VAPFEFLSAGRIVFGSGVAESLGERACKLGRRALWVTGRDRARVSGLEAQLRQAGVELAAFSVASEPRIQDALDAVERGRELGVELVVACGGGSVLDLGKAAAALLANPRDPYDFLEVVGRGQPLARPALPLIALPTTAGTGAEVTKNAVLASSEHAVKASLRHDTMLPAVALVDPQLTLSMPAAVTASTGLDALTQCLEPFVSVQHNPLTDALALEGMRRGATALPRAFRDGSDLAALRARSPQSPLLRRFEQVARVLTGRANASTEDGVAFLDDLARELAVPGLGSYGMTEADVPNVVAKAAVASSMKGNPIALTTSELSEVLRRAL
jgi:alcohol dehydrogenase class IV